MHSQEKDTRCFNRSTSKSVWHNLKKTARSFQSQLSIMERHLRNIGRRLEQREYMHAMVDTMDIKHILKRRILITKLDRVFGIEMKVWEETFKKVMRVMEVLGIPTWMMDLGIGIYMNKKLGTIERKPMNHKRAWSPFFMKRSLPTTLPSAKNMSSLFQGKKKQGKLVFKRRLDLKNN